VGFHGLFYGKFTFLLYCGGDDDDDDDDDDNWQIFS
jgi:hypothetical protein